MFHEAVRQRDDDTRHDMTQYTRQSEETTTDCDRCGGDRPYDAQRFMIAFQDRTDGTILDERLFLCSNCWETARTEAWRCTR